MSTPSARSTSTGAATDPRAPGNPGRTLPAPRAGSDPVMPARGEQGDTRTAARLIVTRGAVAGTIFPITGGDVTIGRDDDCDLVINDITVSRYHAEIRREGDRFTIDDTDSLNGVYVNRRPVQHAQLAEGDEIWIGKARFTFHLPTHSDDAGADHAAEPGGEAGEHSDTPPPQGVGTSS